MTVAKMQHSPKPPSLFSLKKNLLSEVNTSRGNAYNGYVLKVKVIDWATVIEVVHMIVNDEYGEVERLATYNWPDNDRDTKVLLKTFPPNRTLSIINPFMSLPLDHDGLGPNIVLILLKEVEFWSLLQ